MEMYVIGLLLGTGELLLNTWFFYNAFTIGSYWWCAPVGVVAYTYLLGSTLFSIFFHVIYLSTVALTYMNFGIWYAAVAFLVCMGLAEITGTKQQSVASKIAVQPHPHEGESSTAAGQLEAIETLMKEYGLYAYELKNGLIPDGGTEQNPGYGPMDIDEWRKWKQSEYDRTGNLWHNHPNGLPPSAGYAS
jgi:hypothetical protein